MGQVHKVRLSPAGLQEKWSAWVLAAIALFCLLAVAAALVSQHYFAMQPCPWCVLQRAIFLLIALVCGLALIGRRRILRLCLCALAWLLSMSGIAAALWQHLGAANSFSCGFSVAEQIISGLGLDRLAPSVFAPQTSCADGAVDLFGIPYEFWSLALFGGIAIALATIGVAARRAGQSSFTRDAT